MIVHSLRSPSLGLCRMRIVFAVVRKLIRQDDATRTPSGLPPSLPPSNNIYIFAPRPPPMMSLSIRLLLLFAIPKQIGDTQLTSPARRIV